MFRIKTKDNKYKIQIPVKIFGKVLYWKDFECSYYYTLGGDSWPTVHYLKDSIIISDSYEESVEIFNHFKNVEKYKGYKIKPIIKSDWELSYTILKLCEKRYDLNDAYSSFYIFKTIKSAKDKIDEITKEEPKWEIYEKI